MSLPGRSNGEQPMRAGRRQVSPSLNGCRRRTGGHVMPGSGVAEALRERGWSVSWLGTRAGMEHQLVEPHGIAFDAIDFSGLRGKGIKTFLLGGFICCERSAKPRADSCPQAARDVSRLAATSRCGRHGREHHGRALVLLNSTPRR